MPLEHVVDLLPAFIDGELSDEERSRVEGHLRECEECRQEHTELRDLDEKLARELAPLADGRDLLLARVREVLPEVPRWNPLPLVRCLSLLHGDTAPHPQLECL